MFGAGGNLGSASGVITLDIGDAEREAQKLARGLDTLNMAGAVALGNLAAEAVKLGAKLAIDLGKAGVAAVNELNREIREGTNTIIIGTGASGAALDDMRQRMINLGGSSAGLGHNLNDVAGVLAELNTRLDVTGDQLENASDKVLHFARIHELDAVPAARLTGQLINALGLEAADTGLLLDKLTLAGQMSGIAVDKLGQMILDAGPSFEELGFDLDRSIALFASFEKAGARPEEVIGSMTKALNTLAKEQTSQIKIMSGGVASMAEAEHQLLKLTVNLEKAEKAQERLNEKGSEAEQALNAIKVADYRAEIENLQTAMAKGEFVYEQVEKDTNAVAKAFETYIERIKDAPDILAATNIANELFGARVGSKVAEDIRAGRFEVDEWTEAIANACGTLDDVAERTLTFRDRFEVAMERGRLAMVPLSDLLDFLAAQLLPRFEAALEEHIMPAIEQLAHFVNVLVAGLEGGIEPLTAVENALIAAFGEETAGLVMGLVDGVMEIVDQVRDFAATVEETVTPLVEFIGEFVRWQDVLLALAAAVAVVVLPIIWSIAAPILTIIAIVAAAVTAVSVARRAWREDWGGIASFLTDAWESHIRPALAALQRWITEEVIPAAKSLWQQWTTQWWPEIRAALATAWEFIVDVFGQLKRWVLEELIPTVVDLYETWSARWAEIETALGNSWTIIEAIFEEIDRWINENIRPWIEHLREQWQEDWEAMQADLEAVWAIIEPLWLLVQGWLKEKIPEALALLQGKWDSAMAALVEPADRVRQAIDDLLAAAQRFWSWLSSKTFSFNISIPDLPAWALPGSPLPIHTAWRDFADDLNRLQIAPRVDLDEVARLMRLATPAVTVLPAPVAVGGGKTVNLFGGQQFGGRGDDGRNWLDEVTRL